MFGSIFTNKKIAIRPFMGVVFGRVENLCGALYCASNHSLLWDGQKCARCVLPTDSIQAKCNKLRTVLVKHYHHPFWHTYDECNIIIMGFNYKLFASFSSALASCAEYTYIMNFKLESSNVVVKEESINHQFSVSNCCKIKIFKLLGLIEWRTYSLEKRLLAYILIESNA